MAVSYQLVIDCTSPEPLAQFWAEALHYVIEPPPPASTRGTTSTGRSVYPRTNSVSAATASRIPTGRVRASGSRSSPRQKSIKNRIHIDVTRAAAVIPRSRPGASGSRLRPRGSWPSVRRGCADRRGRLDHYAVALTDPEGNEFDIN